jgi:phosphatidylglycerophosphate synthase
MYSVREIKDSMPKNKSSVSSFWVKLVARRLSYLFTFFLVNIGCTANFVSVLSAVVVLAGCVLLSINQFVCMLIGVILINLWIVLDCCDGNIARVTKKSSYMGEFVDAASGYVICAFSCLALGIAAYNCSDLLFGANCIWLIVIGAIGSITDIFARLIYQKYTNCVFVTECKLNGSASYTPENYSFYDPKARKGLTYLRLVIDRQLGISGLFMPFLIVAFIFNLFDVMVCFYTLYHVASLLGTVVLFGMKSVKYDKEHHTSYEI